MYIFKCMCASDARDADAAMLFVEAALHSLLGADEVLEATLHSLLGAAQPATQPVRCC